MNFISTFLDDRFSRQVLLHLLTVTALLAIFLVYSDSIFHGKMLLVGHGDIGSRFQIAMNYARSPSQVLDMGGHVFANWLGVWPPIPFIIQGFILRLALFPGMSNADAGIIAVELTSVFLTLLGFYFISRTVALQVNEFAGLLACLMGFCASIMFYLAHTGLSEVYAFFFISLAIYNLFRFIKKNQGLSWAVSYFAIAFFCRSESLILALFSGVFLIAHRKCNAGIIVMGTIVFLAISKLLGASFLIEGTKFFEHGPSGKGVKASYYSLGIAWNFLKQFGNYNQKLLLLFCICILPLFCFVLKSPSENFLGENRDENEEESQNQTSATTARKISWLTLPTEIYRQINLWVVHIPMAFWGIGFLLTMGVIFRELLRGNISPQFRYLFMANIFMTTLISLIASQTIQTFYFRKSRLAKQLALAMTTILIVFSLWLGFSHATAQDKPELLWNLSSSYKKVILFIREHNPKGDRVAFDSLYWRDEQSLAVYLLNPTHEPYNQFSQEFRSYYQFSQDSKYIGRNQEIKSLLPKQLPSRQDEFSALVHAFIYLKKPRFFILRSDTSYKNFIDSLSKKNSDEKTRESISPIRDYLSSIETDKRQFIFKSPYILPEVEIPLTKVYETKDFLILERKT